MRTALLAVAAGLILTGCGGGGVSTSGKDISMATVTGDASAEQACIDLFGKANELGSKFSEADFTWVGHGDGDLWCYVTPVGKTQNDAPVSFQTGKQKFNASIDAGNGWYLTPGTEVKGAWSDDQKKAVADLAAQAAKHVKP